MCTPYSRKCKGLFLLLNNWVSNTAYFLAQINIYCTFLRAKNLPKGWSTKFRETKFRKIFHFLFRKMSIYISWNFAEFRIAKCTKFCETLSRNFEGLNILFSPPFPGVSRSSSGPRIGSRNRIRICSSAMYLKAIRKVYINADCVFLFLF
jgi:hypothetical protein